MPRRPKDDHRHRITNVERAAFIPVALSTFSKGDTVVRHGTPCLVVEVAATGGQGLIDPENDRVWLANLVNGSVWPAPGADQVHPCFDVQLNYNTCRWQS